jgi:hypothetical protein
MVLTLEQGETTLVEIKVGNSPSGPGYEGLAYENTLFPEFPNPFREIVHGKSDMVQTWAMVLEKLRESWVVDRAQQFDNRGAATKCCHFGTAFSFNHAAVTQFKFESFTKDAHSVVHIADNVCDVVNVLEHTASSLCSPMLANGCELKGPAKAPSDFRAKLAGSAPASGWAATCLADLPQVFASESASTKGWGF